MSLSASALLSSKSQTLLKRVTTASEGSGLYNTWKYMAMCFDTPRPSSQEEAMRKKILSIANTLKLDAAVDDAGNVRVRKPATPGYEDRVRIVVQGHLDMVCSKTKDSTHDFDKDALDVTLTDDGWVQATGTTLGADDGIGVASALMLLENNDFTHGPLECLFTVEEETTMGGAINLAKRPFLEAQALINVDSEEDNSICVGCAGGAEMKLSLPVQRESSEVIAALPSPSLVTISVSGLVGGHTGVDIHTNRANAIVVISRIVSSLVDLHPGLRLCSISGGNAVNAIPRDAQAVVLLPTLASYANSAAAVDALMLSLKAAFSEQVRDFAYAEAKARIGAGGAGGFGGTDEEEEAAKAKALAALTPVRAIAESTMKLEVQSESITDIPAFMKNYAPVTEQSTHKILAMLEAIPHGVLRTSPEVEGDVDTSNALSLIGLSPKPEVGSVTKDDDNSSVGRHGHCDEVTEGDVFWAHCFYRSFSDYQLTRVARKLRAIGSLAGAKCTEPFGYFNGWEPNISSPLFASVYATHRALFPEVKNLRVYSVHAGLECGPIMNQYPDLHAVSIGPLIVSAHSPDEKMRVASVGPFVQWLVASIEALSKVNAKDF